MKKMYVFVALLSTCSIASAQENKEESLKREVTIEKEFTPIVNDASKINTLPEIDNPVVTKPSIRYSDWAVPMTTGPILQILPSGNFGMQPAVNPKQSYINLAMGNYLNAAANAGFRIFDSETDQLGVWYQHSSTNGKLKYLENDKKVTQRRNDNILNLSYKHTFEKLSWKIGGAYRSNAFNYYGMPLIPEIMDIIPESMKTFKMTNQQRVQQYSLHTGIESKDNEKLNYDLSVGYNGYKSRLGFLYEDKNGLTENHIETRFNLSAPFGKYYAIGLGVGMDNLIYSQDQYNYTVIRLNPNFNITKNNLKFRAGLNVDISFNDGTTFRFAPDLNLEWEFEKSFFLFTSLEGGKELNTMNKMSVRSIYADPSRPATNSYTPADWTFGLRTNYLANFNVNLYTGIKTTTDALFDYRTLIAYDGVLSRDVISFFAMDAYAWKVGFDINYKYKDRVKAQINWAHNEWHYRHGKGKIRTALPVNEWNLGLNVNATKHLAFDLDIYLANGREYRNTIETDLKPDADFFSSGKMKNIFNVNLGATYRFNDSVHLLVQANNIFAQHYNLYYGMPAQRFNIMAGVGVCF